ncbi:MAG TPA: adenylosuccinate synthase [Actinomycetota bacterium]
MPATVLIGAQWGDEGKGKITDILGPETDVIVRYQGGNNAGHTVIAGDVTLKLHLVPSGILYPEIVPMIGDGVVVDPAVLIEEMDALAAQGISTDRLLVSVNAHLIMPYHRLLDAVIERHLGRSQLGTTKRGIGPAYADKASRIGLRVQDLLDMKIFEQKLEVVLKERNAVIAKIYNRLPLKAVDIMEQYAGFAKRLAPHIADTSLELWGALRGGKRVLFEGAQGTLLDVDHGTYPFVTSSNPVAGGACTGGGVGPREISRVIGIAKAYVSRVGAGPFPTEDLGPDGDRMIEIGQEFGTTTGRRRRCGWMDAVLLRYAARLNSLSDVFLTKLDVLSGFEQVKICVAYRHEGTVYDEFPPHQSIFHNCEPVYETLPGWDDDISNARTLAELPSEARAYVQRIEEISGVPITLVSVGPERDQTVRLDPVGVPA